MSIVMPAYNSDAYIGAAIQSVLDQTFSDWELLIVDDGSTDKTATIAQKYAESDSRIQLSVLASNRGPAVARNVAIDKANGDLIAFLDSDDYYYDHFLERIVEFVRKNNTGVAYASYDRIRENGAVMRPYRVPSKISYRQLLYSCPISCLTGVYDVRQCGKVLMDDIGREDYSLWLKLLRDKVAVAYGVDEPLAVYRVRRRSGSRNKLRMAAQQWRVYRDYLSFSLLRSLWTFAVYVVKGVVKYLP